MSETTPVPGERAGTPLLPGYTPRPAGVVLPPPVDPAANVVPRTDATPGQAGSGGNGQTPVAQATPAATPSATGAWRGGEAEKTVIRPPGAAWEQPRAATADAASLAEADEPSRLDKAKASVASAATAVVAKTKQSAAKASAVVSGAGAGTATAAAEKAVKPRRTRRARLRISRIDPWSVMKTSLLFGIAGGTILVVATYVVMSVIEATGLFTAINQVARDVLSSPTDPNPFDITQYVNTRRATGLAALIGAIDVVIFTALATVFSFLYNLSATMLGGLEITLAED